MGRPRRPPPPAAIRDARRATSADQRPSTGDDPVARLVERWELALDILAADLEAERAAAAHDPQLLLAKVEEASSTSAPNEVVGYWVWACRRVGVSWSELASYLGVSRQTAQRRFESWVDRFSRGGSRRAGGTPPPLPAAVSSFVGRTVELAELSGLVASARLVTLCGAPGVGKTRLALELANALSRDGLDVAWVALSRVNDPGLLTDGLARALGLREQPGQSLLATAISHLQAGPLLLVLDNCEHLVGACAELVARLLEACPDLTVLATSREVLGAAGEKAWPVPPLSLPAAGTRDTQQLAAAEAVRLFAQRAADVQPAFELDAEVVPVVGDICRSLDGIALAIELAAARIGVLTPAEIASRLEHRFRLLGPARPTALSPHESLRAALDWSHDLLGPLEQVTLRRLAVFNGGCTLAAAEAVCAGEDIEPERVLDLLAGLAAKSLVIADTGGPETRYRMLDTVRQYARERLEASGEADRVVGDHARWYLALAERAEPELTGPDQALWLERLDRDHDNLRSALRSLSQGPVEPALRLAAALTVFWRVRGSFREGRGWLEALQPAGEGAPAGLRAKALWGAGFLAVMMGDNRGALPVLEEALDLYRQEADASGQARALLLLGCSLRFVAGSAAGLAVLEESVDQARAAGDTWCLALGLAMCGWTCIYLSDFAAARPPLQESLDAARAVRDRLGLVLALNGLGFLALTRGDYGLAEDTLEEACAVARGLGDSYDTTTALTYLGALALGRGDHGTAQEHLDEALALARAAGSGLTTTDPLWYLGQLALARGDPEAARTIFSEHLAIATRAGSTRGYSLWGLGAVAARGDGSEARALLDAALAAGRARDDKLLMARVLSDLGRLSRIEGDEAGAASCHHEALQLRAEMDDLPGIADSLEAVGGLAARQDRATLAARLFGAAYALRDAGCYARWPAHVQEYEEDVASARQALPDADFEAAWMDGAALPLSEALAYARRGRGPRGKAATGWASLSRAERDVAALVAAGLSNPEIADRLLMSRATVKAHLGHAFAKLGVASRLQLAMEASRHEEEGHSPSGEASGQE